MGRIYKIYRWLSLDIVTGAIFFLAYLSSYYQIELTFSTYFALSAAIWLIYTTDHLIDARKVGTPSNGRHQFHKKHHRSLLILAVVVLICGLVNVYFLPLPIIRNGAILSAVCVAYLLVVFLHKRFWIKELIVAVAYAAGIFLAPFSLLEQTREMDYLLFVQLFLIAFINLLVFSYYDFENDQRDGFSSLVIQLGLKRASGLIHGVCLLTIGVSGIAFLQTFAPFQGLLLLMSVILYAVFLLPHTAGNERYRIIGDGVFFLPVLFLL